MVVAEFTVEVDVHHNQEGLPQPEEDRQLHAFPAKTAGRQNAEQILDLEGKMISQRVAVSSSVTEVTDSIKALRADLTEGHRTNGSLIQGHRDNISEVVI